MISNLDKEIDSIKNSIKELLTNAQLREQDINVNYLYWFGWLLKVSFISVVQKQNLKEALRALEESKADKNWIQMEINMVCQLILKPLLNTNKSNLWTLIKESRYERSE